MAIPPSLPVQSLPLLTVVASLVAVPKDASSSMPSLPPGTLGTVVEQLDASYCLVEFAGDDGISVGEVPLRYDELLSVSWAGGPSVAALKGLVRQPVAPVSVEEMARVGPEKAVADMRAFIEEGRALARATPAEALPKPPTGFDSWLDYAVECMDTRSAELEHLFDDTGATPSRAAIEQAVRKELAELRELAALQARLGHVTTGILTLDDELLAKAQALTGISEKSSLVREALRALIQRESANRLALLGGSEPQLA